MEYKDNAMVGLAIYEKTQVNAGPKAKIDIERVLLKEFNFVIDNVNSVDNSNIGKIKRAIECIKKNYKYKDAKLVLLQVPYSDKNFFTNKIKNKYAIIHDIEGLRYNNSKILTKELKFYKQCTYIISHNVYMTDFLVERGIDRKKIVELELFDYLTKVRPLKRSINNNIINVVYSGNLDKAQFIKQIEENKMCFNLYTYGIQNCNINNKKIFYKGKYTPDEIPGKMEGNLGLVWDGNIDSKDENDSLKNYTKYNNPHKLSCYIAAELPVIVWSKAAIATLVDKYNIGYKIDNLYDINNLDYSDYYEKLNNIRELSKKVRSGYFTKKAINEILNRLEN